jgi:hypothetical protein
MLTKNVEQPNRVTLTRPNPSQTTKAPAPGELISGQPTLSNPARRMSPPAPAERAHSRPLPCSAAVRDGGHRRPVASRQLAPLRSTRRSPSEPTVSTPAPRATATLVFILAVAAGLPLAAAACCSAAGRGVLCGRSREVTPPPGWRASAAGQAAAPNRCLLVLLCTRAYARCARAMAWRRQWRAARPRHRRRAQAASTEWGRQATAAACRGGWGWERIQSASTIPPDTTRLPASSGLRDLLGWPGRPRENRTAWPPGEAGPAPPDGVRVLVLVRAHRYCTYVLRGCMV